MSSNEASELRIAIARVLERWQVERMKLALELQDDTEAVRVARLGQLSEHIAEIKQAITPEGGPRELDPFVAEVARAERLTRDPPTGDRIEATLSWIQARGAGGAVTVGNFCDECGATLGMVNDGDGSPSRPFCYVCQADELHAIVGNVAGPPIGCIGGGALGGRPVVVPGVDLEGMTDAQRTRALSRWLFGAGGAGGDGAVRVRSLTEEEQRDMRAYLEFVQREPLPTTDAAARHRLEEAAVNWPQMAALFGPR